MSRGMLRETETASTKIQDIWSCLNQIIDIITAMSELPQMQFMYCYVGTTPDAVYVLVIASLHNTSQHHVPSTPLIHCRSSEELLQILKLPHIALLEA